MEKNVVINSTNNANLLKLSEDAIENNNDSFFFPSKTNKINSRQRRLRKDQLLQSYKNDKSFPFVQFFGSFFIVILLLCYISGESLSLIGKAFLIKNNVFQVKNNYPLYDKNATNDNYYARHLDPDKVKKNKDFFLGFFFGLIFDMA